MEDVQFIRNLCTETSSDEQDKERLNVPNKIHIRMLVLILTTVLLCVSGSDADTGLVTSCQDGFCISLSGGELTTEAGLCVVIPCSFSMRAFFPQNIVWSKCEPSKQICDDADMIFNSNNDEKVQAGFKGRVSLLESNLWQKNCSIIINDLKESDSGSYQLRVNGFLFESPQRYSFSPRTNVSVKGLAQKPAVMIPPLTEGQQTTLSCTAPGLCSGAVPDITWTWRGEGGESDSHISGNVTAFNTEDLTDVARRHSSTLTFNSSAEHHRSSFTCEVSYTGDMTTRLTLSLTMNHKRRPRITGDTTVKEGSVLNLTCSAESFPFSLVTWTKFSSNTSLPATYESASLLVPNVTTEHSGRYVCTAQYLGTAATVYADVTVTLDLEKRCGSDSGVLAWVVAGVSLALNVLLMSCILGLRNKRKKQKPTQEDRTHMSLQKTNVSPD